MALALGAALALIGDTPFPSLRKRATGTLLKVCIVLLGFGMDLPVVLRAGAEGAGFAAVSIAVTLALGVWLGRWLRIGEKVSTLISVGTAICGGSAIAAVGAVIGVAESEITVALGAVFVLNAVALYVFPLVGWALHLTPSQFGLWSAIAIHDISSVVGASSQFGTEALQVATAVKLSRALWIIPIAAATAWVFRPRIALLDNGGSVPSRAPLPVPWFIGFFLLASGARSFIPVVATAAPALGAVAHAGMTLTLFLIGSGLSAAMLRQVGWRPLAQGLALWVTISIGSLLVIQQWF